MNIPPVTPTDADVLDLIRQHWSIALHDIRYFPEGFGAHHWQGLRHGEPIVLITLDAVTAHRSADDLKNAYAAAEELNNAGFPYAVTPFQSSSGRRTVAINEGLLSVAYWKHGETPTQEQASSFAVASLFANVLHKLHAAPAPPSLQPWKPGFDNIFAVEMKTLAGERWDNGPLGEDARKLLRQAMPQIESATRGFSELAALADAEKHRWVPTHGEPHFANQVWSDTEMFLVDWESFRLAPPERDLLDLPDRVQETFHPRAEMIDLFRLEWTLSEIRDYAEWFSQPHVGTGDDHLALQKFREELEKL